MKFLKLITTFSLAAGILVGCGNPKDEISVVSRESGSGTRDAFIELTDILEKGPNRKADKTTKEAVVQNNTEGVVTTVMGNKNSIGYISLGSLNDKTKAVTIDSVEPTAQNILDKKYNLRRPFVLVWKDNLSEQGKDFLKFVDSEKGQNIVQEKGYVKNKVEESEKYSSTGVSGNISVVGSTSVTSVMEKLAEEYKKLNPNVTISITSNGSSAGITSVKEGSADIGMTSRELKKSEQEGLNNIDIAYDGIVIIVNKENNLTNLSLEQLRQIFKGELTTWGLVGN